MCVQKRENAIYNKEKDKKCHHFAVTTTSNKGRSLGKWIGMDDKGVETLYKPLFSTSFRSSVSTEGPVKSKEKTKQD